MADTNIGERVATLEAQFEAFQNHVTTNQRQIMDKLDKIEVAFETRREKVNTKFAEIDKKTPAIIQQIVLVLSTGSVAAIISAAVSYWMSKLP